MAIVTTDNKHYQAIAEKVREFKGTQETMLPSEMPLKIQEVYDVGYEKGLSEAGDTTSAYEQGHADGKQAEYDEFWDTFQVNGTRKDYKYSFCRGWKDEIFKPKYPFNLSGSNANYMFMFSTLKKSPYLLSMDFSQCSAIIQTFYESTIEELGVLDFRKVSRGWNGLQQTFSNCYNLKKIELIKMPTTSIQNNSAFGNCNSLTEIRFEGKLFEGQNFKWCPLSKESIESIISCLADTSSSSHKLTLKETAVNTAFETAEGLADGSTSDEWLSLISSKSNWTISLV